MIKKILISQPYPTSEKSPYFDIEKKYGIEITFHPFIKVEGLSAKEFRQQKVQILDHTAIVFTSRHAIDHFFTLCKELRVNIPEDMKYFGLSETIALYIQKYVQYRKRKVFFSQTGKWPDLVQVMAKHKALLQGADLLIWEQGIKNSLGQLEISGGNKGIVTFDMKVQSAEVDIHSSFGGVIDSASWYLLNALASLRGKDGRIQVEELYDQVIAPNQRELALVEQYAQPPSSVRGRGTAKRWKGR